MVNTHNMFKDRILLHHSKLTKAQKLVAEYILRNMNMAAVSPAAEIGEKSGVSETTVIRLCHTLGYQGYSEMQKEMQQQLLQNRSSLETFVASNETLADETHFYKTIMEKDRQQIYQVSEKLNQHMLDDIVETLIHKKNVLIVGVKASYPAALWFKYSLHLLRSNVSVYREDVDHLFYLSNEINSDWVVVVLTFHRYGSDSLNIAKMAKANGATVIGITDSHLSPIAAHTDLLIPLEFEQQSTLDLITPLLSFLHSLIAAYSVQDYENVRKRMEVFEQVTDDHETYFIKSR